MLKNSGPGRTTTITAAVLATLAIFAGQATAVTPFQTDVTTAIDRGIEWIANNNGFTGGAGDATGLVMQALLEKRAPGDPNGPPLGYLGANATDQARLRAVALYVINQTNANGNGFYAYRDGARLFALAGYALTGGPDKSTLGSAITLKQAMDLLTSRTLAQQNATSGYWCYYDGWCNDSSTTQFAAAGLHAAKSFYKSALSGDGGVPFADAAKVAAIEAALAKIATSYGSAPYFGTGSDNASCGVLSATEKGHGYHPADTGYRPSLQQTASGIYIQLFGGKDVNTPAVQNYMEWVRNRYRWQNLDSMGNGWEYYSWSYYMWSSFKAMELIRQSGVVPAAGNLTADAYGKLPAASAPACNQRQENKDPAAVSRPASFGGGGAGFYTGEAKGQYFDYAHQILGHQCYDGSLPINGNDGYFGCNLGGISAWDSWAHQAYLLLVLQRSTGNVVLACDVDGDRDVDVNDVSLIRQAIGVVPQSGDPRDANLDGKITVNDVRMCTLRCTKAKCAP